MSKESNRLKCLFGFHEWNYVTYNGWGNASSAKRKCEYCRLIQTKAIIQTPNNERVVGRWVND